MTANQVAIGRNGALLTITMAGQEECANARHVRRDRRRAREHRRHPSVRVVLITGTGDVFNELGVFEHYVDKFYRHIWATPQKARQFRCVARSATRIEPPSRQSRHH